MKAERWGDTLVHLIRLNVGVNLAAALHGELLVVASSQALHPATELPRTWCTNVQPADPGSKTRTHDLP